MIMMVIIFDDNGKCHDNDDYSGKYDDYDVGQCVDEMFTLITLLEMIIQ